MKEKTLKYMAGILDAEGCVRIATHKRGDKTYYEPKVFLSNKSRALMQWAVLHFGGSFSRNINSNKGEDWFIWYLQSFKAIERFLKLVLPYLKYKKEQAETLLKFIQEKDTLTKSEKESILNWLKGAKRCGSVTTETNSSYLKANPEYLAGFFDGEGCVRVNKTPSKNTISYHLIVTIANNDKSVLDACRDIYGGDVRKKSKGTCYSWSLFNKPKIEQFLLNSIPYLVVKRDEALAALEYVRLGTHKQVPEQREQIYQKLITLKKLKTQSELTGDRESASAEMLTA